MSGEHPFAQYIRALARGKRGSRDLTQEEAYAAFILILRNEVAAEQLGAFLMLMRLKEETPAELAGFVRAARDTIGSFDNATPVQLDWPSYAGKRRQLPWFILSALLLAENGVTVLMHGIGGRKDDRVYTPQAITALGLPHCRSLVEAGQSLTNHGFAFIELSNFLPRLAELIDMRPLFGLRTPVHSLSRLLNPLKATYVLQGIFHPGYKTTHRDAALLLNEPHVAVIKGEGGEIERNPDIDNEIFTVHNGESGVELWPALFSGPRHLKDETMDVRRLAALWRGEIADEYGTAAVTGTAAIALKLLGKTSTFEDSQQLAHQWWEGRNLNRLQSSVD